jgi:hypothetical protein
VTKSISLTGGGFWATNLSFRRNQQNTGGKVSKGDIYRLGQWLKDQGERMAHIRVFGIHIFAWIAGPVIRFGVALKDSVRNCPISEL